MKDHSEFPTKPNYQAIAESLEAENKILTEQVELQTKRLEDLQQGVKDAIDEIIDTKNVVAVVAASIAYSESLRILTEKTGITA